jgi:GNAT superfamily N-acetyltransferase
MSNVVSRSHPTSNPWLVQADNAPETPEYHLRINGMFTLPEARGQGVAKALLLHVLDYGIEEAAKVEKLFIASIVVDSDNPSAKALYQKCGFVPIREEPFNQGRSRMAILMKYTPKIVERPEEVA